MNIPNELKSSDIYSLLLFVLFKLRENKDYQTLSELVYMLDKDSLLKLCEYYGGLTITIPTIEDIEVMVYGLLLYQKVNIDKEDYDVSLSNFNLSKTKCVDVISAYNEICKVVTDYNFRT